MFASLIIVHFCVCSRVEELSIVEEFEVWSAVLAERSEKGLQGALI
jgi:hypothetical protein